MKRFLRPRNVMFDIGANFGYYSLTLAHNLKGECTVYAFEPFPFTYERLMLNVQINHMNSCVRPYKMGLSDTVESARMRVRFDNNTGATYVTRKGNSGVPIHLTTVDSFCVENDISAVDVMKIDVEGFEPRVLKGGEEIIGDTNPSILLELSPACLRRAGSSIDDLADMLSYFGYSLYFPNRDKLVPLTHLPKEPHQLNAFCFPRALTFPD
ncbi:MAG: FkbM family methyltransferase [Thermodesulfobacteriota bacterium]|nr:FkbM family methyltransferase [Thermodesulfobacteriota bacterium]